MPASLLHSLLGCTRNARMIDGLTITIPDGAAPGSILSIPVKGRPENVPPGVSFEDADLGPLMPSAPVAHTVRLETTIGTIDIIVRPDWAWVSGDVDVTSFT
eukprot:Skav204817  [mRNA]  locus=scaffold3914:183213:186207:- [translate_table: standard]